MRAMTVRASHVSLRVPDVAEAESYYSALLGLEVGFRDVQVNGEQYSLPPEVTWPEARKRGLAPGMTALGVVGFVLALEQGAADDGGRLDHVGIEVDQARLTAIGQQVASSGTRADVESEDLLVFTDAYGVRWEITTRAYQRLSDQSTGARLGRWWALD